MTIKRMDRVSVVDLPAAIAFFTTLGMALEGEMPVEGPGWDRLCALEGAIASPNPLGLQPGIPHLS